MWPTRLCVTVVVAVGGLLAAVPLASASRLLTIDAPTNLFDPTTMPPGGSAPCAPPIPNPLALRADVLLPDGYKMRGSARYPVLFLLHGAGQGYDHWAAPCRGNIQALAKGFRGIIVMPEDSAAGYYSDWWDNGLRASAKWESYYLRELIPLIERRYRVRSGRRWHAIAGLSMGGYGAMYLASQLPGYFGSAASFSGALDNQDPGSIALLENGEMVYGKTADQNHIWGPPDGWYSVGHNPTKLVENLRYTRLFVSYGTGDPCPGDSDGSDFDGLGPDGSPALNPPLGTPTFPAVLKATEQGNRTQSMTFDSAAAAAGLHVHVDAMSCGTHWWDNWWRAFRAARAWDLFANVPSKVPNFTYTTTAQTGDAWGLRYSLAAPPTNLTTLTRQGSKVEAQGEGRLTLTSPNGCTLTATMPFTRTLLAKRCRRR